MGSLTLPKAGIVYVDANTVIYTTDRHPVYGPVCDPLWNAVQSGHLTVVSSELILLETLVGPLRSGDQALANRRRAMWNHANARLVPITQDILYDAAQLRAGIPALRTPDAIHAATAQACAAAVVVTNDKGFLRLPGLAVELLDEVVARK